MVQYNAEWIKRNITHEEFRQLMQAKYSGRLPGLLIKRDIQRHYPEHPRAASILGFALSQREYGFEPLGPYINMHGIEGLENTYDEYLMGDKGVYQYYVNRFGSPEKDSLKQISPSRTGVDLLTTVDLKLQGILKEQLSLALNNHKAEACLGIIMDPRTGAILASASVENMPDQVELEHLETTPVNCWPAPARRNLATSSVFEPGSIWKPVIMAIALEHGLAVPGEILPWKRAMVFGRKAFYDWKDFPETIGLDEVLIYSSNVGIIQISNRLFSNLSHSDIAEEIHKMGFNRRYPVDFPSRPRGLLSPAAWGPISVGAVAEGYELGVTLVQLGGFYCMIANGGLQVEPHFGKALLDPGSGIVIRNLEKDKPAQVISPQTAGFIRQAMTDCVDHGTGKRAKLTSYDCVLAGKTATAKLLVNGTYASGKYRASFAGFFPAENPEYVMVVSVKDPQEGGYYGGVVAAPLFGSIAERIAAEVMELDPIVTTPVEKPNAPSQENQTESKSTDSKIEEMTT